MFLGAVESPLILRAYIERMSRAELFKTLALIMSTICGALLVLYDQTVGALVPHAVAHMISASLISLPAAIVIARIMVPDQADTVAEDFETGLSYENRMDAVVRGAMDGMQLFLEVIAIILVMFALVALANHALAALPIRVATEPLTVDRMLGWLFAPLMWLIGIPLSQAGAAGALMGTKSVLTEYVAYLHFADLPTDTFSPWSRLIVIYALSGVANLASVGLIISTIGTLVPSRRPDVASLGMKSWLAGNAATAFTGATIGLVTFLGTIDV